MSQINPGLDNMAGYYSGSTNDNQQRQLAQ